MTLIQRIDRDGATPILMTFAWAIPEHYTHEAFQSYSVGYNNPENYDRWPAELWGSPDYVREGLRRHNKAISELADNEGVPLIDQEKLIGRELRWFGDVCHFSDEGTERFIENIADFFIRHRLFRVRDSEPNDSASNLEPPNWSRILSQIKGFWTLGALL